MLADRELPDDVRDELSDPEFINRTHGRRSTYAVGCRGPLCRKAERDEAERKYQRKRARLGAEPARTGLKDLKSRARDEELASIQAWHELMREYAKINYLVQRDEEPDVPPQGISEFNDQCEISPG